MVEMANKCSASWPCNCNHAKGTDCMPGFEREDAALHINIYSLAKVHCALQVNEAHFRVKYYKEVY